MPAHSESEAAPAIRVQSLSKAFDGVPALSEIELDILPGRVHALLGGNGSGKSTLIKILAGVYTADAGTITIGGRRLNATGALTPAVAAEAGLRFVHQDLGLIDDLSVAENLALGAGYPTRWGRIQWSHLRSDAHSLLHRFDIDADPETLVEHLRPATKTMIAVARALRSDKSGQSILVLDEPTARLPDHEVQTLLEALRRRVAVGDAIIYVSHRLNEVMALADDITILRDGRRVTTTTTRAVTRPKLIEMIAGRALTDNDHAYRRTVVTATEALRLDDLTVGAVSALTVSVSAGEIVGLGGLVGAGKSTVLRAIYGQVAIRSGEITLAGELIASSSNRPKVSDLVARGVGFVPEDRAADAALPDMPVRENLSAATIHTYFGLRGHRRRTEALDSEQLCDQFGVKFRFVDQDLATLSGGNQQKVILARWLRSQPRLLLLDEPTQGVDVGARADIYDLLRKAAEGGAAIVVASSDPEELHELCDRVVILRRGAAAATLDRAQMSVTRIIALAYEDEPESVSA